MNRRAPDSAEEMVDALRSVGAGIDSMDAGRPGRVRTMLERAGLDPDRDPAVSRYLAAVRRLGRAPSESRRRNGG